MYYLQVVVCITILKVCLAAEVCPSSDLESLLQSGRFYSYNFLGEAVILSQSGEESRSSLRCDVTISPVNSCHFSLNLRNCSLSESSSNENEVLYKLSKYPVIFSVINGEIWRLYANEEERMDVLNIKRGVLSAFVFKLSQTKKAFQTVVSDIHGICPLTITPLDSGIVKTSRDLNKCYRTDKEHARFNSYSLKKAIDSNIDCSYNIDVPEKRLIQVNCTERHYVDSVHSNIYYKLTYKSSHPQKEDSEFSSDLRQIDIHFEQEQQPPSEPEDFVLVAIRMLSQLAEHSSEGINLSTIADCTDLVAWLRSSNSLTPLLEAIKEISLMDGFPREVCIIF